jgi:molybdopterin molybdotransferase
MVPAGADAVIRVEDTRPADDEVEVVAEVAAGRNIRRAGEDIAAGERVLGPGALLGPSELGVLASAARSQVLCGARPRVAVVVSGDELIAPDEPSWPGAVRDSNAYTVPALVEESGAALHSIEKVGDDAGATSEAIAAALRCVVAVISGGVSVGRHDHIRPSLQELGAEQVFWGVALRPGKPTWFGLGPRGTLVFGLPGNPVSAVVTFILFARPALLAMQGGEPTLRRLSAAMADDYPKKRGRAHAVRCRLEAGRRGWLARPTKEQGSHVLTSMLGADGLAILPAESDLVRAGEQVIVELLPGPTMRA